MSHRDLLRPGSAQWALQTAHAGRAFVQAGEPERGLDLAKEAFAIDSALFGDRSLPAARDMNDIGCACIATGDFESAEKWLLQSLDAYEMPGGELHSHAGMPLLHMGRLYTVLFERADDAVEREALRAKSEKSLRRALKLNSAEGAESAELAATLVALGDAVQMSPRAMGREEALEHFERALAIDKQQYPDDHSEVIIDGLRVANAHLLLGHFTEARQLLESMTEILSRSNDLPLLQAQALLMRISLEVANPDGSRIRVQGFARRLVRLEGRNQHLPSVARDITGTIEAFPEDLRAIANSPDFA